MIECYAIYIQSAKTISEMLDSFKSKGVATEFHLCQEGSGMIKIKHPQRAETYSFKIKMHGSLDGVHKYEIISWTDQAFALSKEWFSDM